MTELVAVSEVRGIVDSAVSAALREQARRTPLYRTGVVVGWDTKGEVVSVLMDSDALSIDVSDSEVIDDEAVEVPAENATGLPMPKGQRVYVQFLPPRKAIVVGLALPNLGPPRAALWRSAIQSIASGGSVDVTLDTVLYDPFSMVAGSTIVIQYDGLYRVDATATFDANAVGRRFVAASLSTGTILVSQQVMASPQLATRLSASRDIPLLRGDIIKEVVVQQSGAALDLSTTANEPTLSVRYVGPLPITRV